MNATESMLDDLYKLQARRAQDIAENGKAFTLSNSEHVFKGIISSDQTTIKFQADAPARPGAVFELKGASFYILSATAKAGCIVADCAPITSSIQVFKKELVGSAVPGKGPTTRLVVEQSSLPSFGVKGNDISVPKHAAMFQGRIVKYAGQLYEVTATRITGPTAILTIKSYIPETSAPIQRKAETTSWGSRPVDVLHIFG